MKAKIELTKADPNLDWCVRQELTKAVVYGSLRNKPKVYLKNILKELNIDHIEVRV